MEDFKYQAFEVTVDTGTDSTVNTSVEFDPNYQWIVGIAAYEKADGGIPSYDIAFAEDKQVHHDFVDKRDFMPSSGVAPDQRYKSVLIQNTKQRFKIRVAPDVATVSPIRFQMVFKLAKEQPR